MAWIRGGEGYCVTGSVCTGRRTSGDGAGDHTDGVVAPQDQIALLEADHSGVQRLRCEGTVRQDAGSGPGWAGRQLEGHNRSCGIDRGAVTVQGQSDVGRDHGNNIGGALGRVDRDSQIRARNNGINIGNADGSRIGYRRAIDVVAGDQAAAGINRQGSGYGQAHGAGRQPLLAERAGAGHADVALN